MSAWQQLPSWIRLSSPLFVNSFPLEPFTFVPLTGTPHMCTYVSFRAYLEVCEHLSLPPCVFDITFTHSLRSSKKAPCLFAQRKAPTRALRLRSPISPAPGTTPSRNVWNSTQQGLAHPCLLSLASVFVILSPCGALETRDGHADREGGGGKRGTVSPEGRKSIIRGASAQKGFSI